MGTKHNRTETGVLNTPLLPNLGLNASKYRRYAIEDMPQIEQTAKTSLAETGTVQFFYFWGVGLKVNPDQYDHICLQMLSEIVDLLRGAFQQKVELTLLMSDVHGRSNGFSDTHIYSYQNQIKLIAESLNFKIVFLSSLFSADDYDRFRQPATVEELQVFAEKQDLLERGALQVGSYETKRERALPYLTTRLREKPVIEQYFRNYILLSGDRKANKILFPNLPTVFIYNTGYKQVQKPWFSYETPPSVKP